MKTLKKVVCVVLVFAVIFGGAFGLIASGIFNKYTFSIDSTLLMTHQ